MIWLWAAAGGALLLSLVVDRQKTWQGLRKGGRLLWNITPTLVGVLALAGLLVMVVSPAAMGRVLGESGPVPFLTALGVGSVALIPGLVAYPLAGVLRGQGASDAVLAAFITTLMMVGVLTLPIEARFFGIRVSLTRNALSLLGAVLVALGMTWVLS